MHLIIIPDLECLLDETPVANIPFDKTFADYRMKPWVIVHTSGSTGVPKIIPLKHGYPSITDAYSRLDINEVAHRWGHTRLFLPFHPSNVAGLVYSVSAPVWIDCTVVLPPPVPLTADVAHSCHIYGHVECSSLPSTIIVDMIKSESQLQSLGRLRNLLYAGGPLPRASAEIISNYTKLETAFTATEYLSLPQLPKAPEDWDYFRFNEGWGGIEFRHTGEGLYEMVLVKDRRLDLMQAAFVTFPHLQEYHTKDLFIKHPTKAGLWKYNSRLDDIIVFNNGEKLNPLTMEGIITACPAITGCLIIGQGRSQSALLVEANDHAETTPRLMNIIWPYVEQANHCCSKHGQIEQGLIFVTPRDKPLIRGCDGTIQRAPNNLFFADEIETVYQQLNLCSSKIAYTPSNLDSFEQTQASLRAILANDFNLYNLGVSDNLFEAGLDTLQVNSLVATINTGRNQQLLNPRVVYDNPTIESLARALQHDTRSETTTSSKEQSITGYDEHFYAMQKMFEDTIWQMFPHEKRQPRRAKDFLFPPEDISSVPPNKGLKAWLQILGSFLIEFNTWGLIYTFGVFEKFYRERLLHSHSSFSISWVGSIQGALFLMVGVITGRLFDKGYFRIIHITAVLLFFFALMMLSLSKLYYQVLLTHGVLLGVSSGFLFNVSSLVLPRHFSTNLGLSQSLAYAGGPFGGVLYPIVFRNLISVISFAETIRIIAVISLLTLGLSALIIRPTNSRPSRQLVDIPAFREPFFLAFLASAFLLFAGLFVPFFTTPLFASDYLKSSRNLSLDLLPALNSAQIIGRVFSALLLDLAARVWISRPPSELIALTACVICAIIAFTGPTVHHLGGFIPWLLAYGLFSGILLTFFDAALPYVCSNLGTHGSRMGMVHLAGGLGFLIGTPIALAAKQKREEWLGVQITTGAMITGAAALFTWPAKEAWRGRRARDLFEKNRDDIRAV